MAPGVSVQREVLEVGRLCSDAAPQNICSKGAWKGVGKCLLMEYFLTSTMLFVKRENIQGTPAFT